jgi:type VI secretion system (T6SS) effector TldE1-like protein
MRSEAGGWGLPSIDLYVPTAYAIDARGGNEDGSLRAELPWIAVGIATLIFGYALGLQASPAGRSMFGTIQPRSLVSPALLGPQIPNRLGVQVASLDADDVPASAFADADGPSGTSTVAEGYVSFDQRLLFDPGAFDQPAGGSVFRGGAPARAVTNERVRTASLAPSDPGEHATMRHAVGALAPKLAPVTAPKLASLPPDADNDTAIYDIAAHTVYLPNGQKLEAHSGLGSLMDDPRHVDAKDRGPTPPNVYELALREETFHGVRALRLTPVGDGNMYGRDGMLAHSYMLGPNGQSNGCVSFSDYDAFLNAFLRGDVHRLVVVEHLDTAPGSKTASGWFPKTIHALFGRS